MCEELIEQWKVAMGGCGTVVPTVAALGTEISRWDSPNAVANYICHVDGRATAKVEVQ